MKAEIVSVTPQMASDWLKLNTDNRPLRRSVVDGFKNTLLRGEYVSTHQGVAFSSAGVLLDGQHRLTAISELRDGAFEMLVVRGLSPAGFKVMDIGVRRTAADALKENPRLVEVARLAAVLSSTSKSTPSPTMLLPYIEMIEPFHTELIEFCPTVSKTWTAAPIRLAAVVAMLRGVDSDYVKTIYRAMVRADFSAMPPVAQSLYRAHINGTFQLADRVDVIARFLTVFDKKRASISKLYIRDKTVATAILRETFFTIAVAHTIADARTATKGKPQPKGAERVPTWPAAK
jgi:hypothetical protein